MNRQKKEALFFITCEAYLNKYQGKRNQVNLNFEFEVLEKLKLVLNGFVLCGGNLLIRVFSWGKSRRSGILVVD